MSSDSQLHKVDQIAHRFYTKLFYVVNDARATEEAISPVKSDKWFNLEIPDSELFSKDAQKLWKNISLSTPPGPPPLEIQVLLSIPELINNQVLVYKSPDSSRVRIEPTPRFILLETWSLTLTPDRVGEQTNIDIHPSTIYKHGIPLFRSLFSLLRVLPAWKLYKRLKRRVGGKNRNGNLGIELRVRSYTDSESRMNVLRFDDPPSPLHASPLPNSSHTFPSVPHPLGSLTLSATYLSSPDFQLDELESLLSSRFLSLDLEGFVPTLNKNHQRDSLTGSSLPTNSSTRPPFSRSPPRFTGKVPPTGENVVVADRFLLTRAPPLGTSASTGTSALIPPPRPFPSIPNNLATSNPPSMASLPPSGIAANRLRKESLNSSSSSSLSTRDLPGPGMSSVSPSPVTGPLPIRRPNINPVHPFKSNTLSSTSGSSPSLSIRQGPLAGGSPLSAGGFPSSLSGPATGSSHSRQPSSVSPNAARFSPSPIGVGFGGTGSSKPSPPALVSPSSLGDRWPSPSGTGGSGDRGRRTSMNSVLPVGGGIGLGLEGVAIEDAQGRMTVPPRKRYSSSFGHRYAGSVGSATGISTGGGTPGSDPASGSLGGDSNAGGSGGRNTPAILGQSPNPDNRKEGGSSIFGTATDDDDISIFVQDIDSRKPLSGRVKESISLLENEREKRNSVPMAPGHEQVYDGITMQPANKGSAVDGPSTNSPSPSFQRPSSPAASGSGSTKEPTSPSLSSKSPLGTTTTTTATTSSSNTTNTGNTTTPAHLSTSPNRGPMLTNQNEVEERLRKMNENFFKSLEGMDAGSSRRKERKSSTGKERPFPLVLQSEEGSSSSSEVSRADLRDPRSVPPYTGVNSPYPLSGLGPGHGRYPSTSTLSHSEAVSQGSEEYIGRMELYEERRRSGYHP